VGRAKVGLDSVADVKKGLNRFLGNRLFEVL